MKGRTISHRSVAKLGFVTLVMAATGVIAAPEPPGLAECLRQENPDAECAKLIQEMCDGSGRCEVDEEITVIGTRMDVKITRYPGSASTLSADDLTTTSSVIESLSVVPGFETGGGHGRNIGQQYTIRGFGYQSEDRVIVKLDGVRRSPSLYSNHISSFRVDNDLLTSVDVVKGASSVLHGGGAIGGVIGMKTKDAYDFLLPGRRFGATAKLRYEDNNHSAAYLALYGTAFDDRFDYLVYNKRGETGDLTLARAANEVAAGEFSDQVDNDEEFDNRFVKIGFNPSPNHRFTLSWFDAVEDTEVTWQTVYQTSYSSLTGPAIGELDQTDVVLRYTGQSDASDLYNLDVTVFDTSSAYIRTLDYELDGAPIHIDYENTDERQGINVKNLMKFTTGAIDHRLLLGIDYEKRNEDAMYIRNGVATDFGSMPNEYRDFGVYIQEEASFLDNRLVLLAGGRYDSFERDVHGGEQQYDSDRFSPRVGLSFELFDGFNLLGNFSESFRAPTPHETSSEGPLNPHYWYLPNPDLEAETAAEYEIGFSFVRDGLFSGGDRLWIKAMYFDGEIDNMIAFEEQPERGVSPDDSPYGTYVNVNKAKRHGHELELRYILGNWSTGATWESLDQYDVDTREKVPNAFADKIRWYGEYSFPRQGILLGLDVSHWLQPDQNPESYVWRGETYTYVWDDYTQTNVRARWRPQNVRSEWLRHLDLELGVNNLNDGEYLNARNVTTTSRVGKGRNVYMSLTKSF